MRGVAAVIPPVQKHCPVCQQVTWWYDGVCKFAYLHPAPKGRDEIVQEALATVIDTLDRLAVPEALSVLSAATERMLISIPNWAAENWIALMREHLERLP